MKWLKMDCDAQDNLDLRKMVDEWGWEWYGRYWAILGKIGMLVTEKRQTFALQTNNDRPFPVRLLADDLSTTVQRLTNFLDWLSDNRLIDPTAWKSQNLIFCPKLRERADEYTTKLLKNRDKLRSVSRHSPEQEVEEEVEQKKKRKSFIPPTPEGASSYFTETLSLPPDEAGAFLDHYTANGWVQGRAGKPVVDWKAAARNWKRNYLKFRGTNGTAHNRQNQSGSQAARASYRPSEQSRRDNQSVAESIRRMREDRGERSGSGAGPADQS